MRKPLFVLVCLSLLLAACGCGPAGTEAPADQEASAPILPLATQAAILPTPTPLPPPPTPTPLPTNTSVPTNTPAPEEAATAEAPPTPTPAPALTDVLVEIPGGPFTMGIDSDTPDEGPAHEVDVAAFQMDKFEVTNTDFAWLPTQPKSGEEVTFSASADGTPPITFSWDLGDGTVAAGAMVSHTYAVPGIYTVTLTATNECGEDTAVQAVQIGPWTLYLPLIFKNYGP